MNNELQKHKTGDTIKWVLTLVGFILVGVMLTGIILGWFEKKEDVPEPNVTESMETDSELVINPEPTSKGFALISRTLSVDEYADYGVSALAEGAYTITATVKDSAGFTSEAVQYVSWSMDWASTNNADVTDYVTMTTDGTTATFSCNQAFSTQIIVTCTSTLDSDISATATLDYAKRLESINFKGTAGLHSGYATPTVNGATHSVSLPNIDTLLSGSDSAWSTHKFTFCTESGNFGLGTVDNMIETPNLSVKVELAPELVTALKAKSELSASTFAAQTYTGEEVTNGVTVTKLLQNLSGLTVAGQYMPQWSAFMQTFSSMSNQLIVTVTVPCMYAGTQTINYTLNCNVAELTVQSVTLDSTSHIF